MIKNLVSTPQPYFRLFEQFFDRGLGQPFCQESIFFQNPAAYMSGSSEDIAENALDFLTRGISEAASVVFDPVTIVDSKYD